jgi:hypothetical protein
MALLFPAKLLSLFLIILRSDVRAFGRINEQFGNIREGLSQLLNTAKFPVRKNVPLDQRPFEHRP